MENEESTIQIRLYHADDFFGELCCWRLESPYSHSAILVDGYVYSAVYPRAVKMLATNTKSPEYSELGIPPRTGTFVTFRVPVEKKNLIKEWLEKHLGTRYDLLSLLGWALRCQSLQVKGTYYCFEFVHSSLVYAGLLPVERSFITAEQLLLDLYEHKIIPTLSDKIIQKAKHQKPAPIRYET